MCSSTAAVRLLFRRRAQAGAAASKTQRVLEGVSWMAMAIVVGIPRAFRLGIAEYSRPRRATGGHGVPRETTCTGPGRTSSSVLVARLQFVFWSAVISVVIRLLLQSTIGQGWSASSDWCCRAHSSLCRAICASEQNESSVVWESRLSDENHEQTGWRCSLINVLIFLQLSS